jgi:spore coat protein U-like protein
VAKGVIGSVLGLGAIALAAPAWAAGTGKATVQMQVSADVISGCTVSAMPMAFVVIPPYVNANVDSTATIALRCAPNTAYTIDIDSGLYPQGINRRVFSSAANAYLTYDVFRDPPKSQVWGTGPAKNLTGNSGSTGQALHTVYGRLAERANMKAGSYQDTLTVTVSF